MTEPETPENPPPAITEAWGRLCDWACAQRRDWDGPAVKAAMREAANRDASYRDVADILWRLGRDLEARTREVLGELSCLNRTGPGPGRHQGAGPAPDVLAALKAGDYEGARRQLGTSSVVDARTSVPSQGTAPETETANQEGKP